MLCCRYVAAVTSNAAGIPQKEKAAQEKAAKLKAVRMAGIHAIGLQQLMFAAVTAVVWFCRGCQLLGGSATCLEVDAGSCTNQCCSLRACSSGRCCQVMRPDRLRMGSALRYGHAADAVRSLPVRHQAAPCSCIGFFHTLQQYKPSIGRSCWAQCSCQGPHVKAVTHLSKATATPLLCVLSCPAGEEGC